MKGEPVTHTGEAQTGLERLRGQVDRGRPLYPLDKNDRRDLDALLDIAEAAQEVTQWPGLHDPAIDKLQAALASLDQSAELTSKPADENGAGS